MTPIFDLKMLKVKFKYLSIRWEGIQRFVNCIYAIDLKNI